MVYLITKYFLSLRTIWSFDQLELLELNINKILILRLRISISNRKKIRLLHILIFFIDLCQKR